MSTHPTSIEAAILRTLLYADIFDFPLTLPEIHHFLIAETASLAQVQITLESSAWLAERITPLNGYYTIRPETADLRHSRAEISAQLWEPATQYGHRIAYLPFVRMVALTGALAMHNANTPQDDFDYLVVTLPQRVWLARLMTVALVRWARLWHVQLCPNYVLSQDSLTQTRQDMYIAHELAQMVPISGHALYHQMRQANTWADSHLPNAIGAFYPLPEPAPNHLARLFQQAAEWVLGGWLGDKLESWEHARKRVKLSAKIDHHTQPTAAILDKAHAKGHFHDYGHHILARFAQHLASYQLYD